MSYNFFRSLAAILFVVSVLVSCAEQESRTPSRAPLLAAMLNNTSSPGRYVSQQDIDAGNIAENEYVVQVGTGEFMAFTRNSANNSVVDVSDEGNVSLNLVNVSVADAARAVLGEALGLSFTVEEGIAGLVTLQTTQAISKDGLLEIFQTILEAQGITLNKSGELVSVVRFENATRNVVRLGNAQGIGARVVAAPLEYVSAEEIVRLLTPIVGRSVGLQASENRNILLISGTKDEVNAAIEAVNLFDVDILRGKSVGLYKLRAADPTAVAVELEQIFETQEGGALNNVIKFVPNNRLNAILVISNRPRYLADAQTWIERLDAAANGSRRRPVVYQLENRSAEDLAPILAEMAGIQSSGEVGQASALGQVRIIPDNTRNAVVVWGNGHEQSEFAQLISTLDTTPVQVLIEATIAEVALTDELNFGVRWFFESGLLSSTFTDASSGSVGANFPGLSFLFQGANGAVALNALSSITDVNVVSSPSLLVLDNHEATLQIGDQVPVATQQSSGTSNTDTPVVTTISFRDTGIILRVKPRISSAGRVVLDIEQEVSSVANTTTSGIDSPTISQRKINTSVVVTDGETLVLGGLIQESSNNTRNQVPLAGDVPILGNLFRSRDDRQNRTELLILITPRVIRDGTEARAITEEFRGRLAGPNQLIFATPSPSGLHRLLD